MADITPEPIIQIMSGFMASKHLMVANEIGLFEKLAGGAATLDKLAKITGVPHRTLRIVADAMVALRLAECEDGKYRNGPAAQAFLAGIGPMDMRPFVRFWDRLSYPRWTRLAESVRAGKGPFGELSFTKEEQEIFSKGVEGFTVAAAMGLTANYDFHGHERILDLGGGTGVFLMVLLGQVMGLQGTLFELPAAAAVARPIIAASPVADRIKVVDGDFFKGPIPDGHDAVILANVIHLFQSQPNIELLRRLRPQVQIGARLLIVDFWTDPTHTQPVLAALMAGEFLIQAGQGDVYSDDDAKEWFAKTGWKFVEKKPLAGAQSLVVAEAV